MDPTNPASNRTSINSDKERKMSENGSSPKDQGPRVLSIDAGALMNPEVSAGEYEPLLKSKDPLLAQLPEHDDENYRMCRYRCFPGIPHLLPHGSIPASGFNLASATLGAGTLAIPQAMYQAGALLGSIMLVCICAGTVYSIRLLMIVFEKTGYVTYEEMARRLIGWKFEKFTAFLIVAFCWGITIVYVVAMGDILEKLSETSWFPSVFQGNDGKKIMQIIFWTCFMLPLSLQKEINTLRYASMIGILSSFVLVTAIVVHAANDHPPASNINLAQWNHHLLVAIPVFSFAYCCQTNCFEIYTEMRHRSINKMTATAAGSMSICTLLYIIAGVAGLANFGPNIRGDILNDYHPTESAYICIAFVCISITLTMAFPICIFPTRDAILQMMGYKDAYNTPNFIRIGLCFSLAAFSLVTGLFTPGIQVLFGVLGGVCGSSLSFMWPALFIMKMPDWGVEHYGRANVIAVWVLMIAGFVFGALGTVVSLYQNLK